MKTTRASGHRWSSSFHTYQSAFGLSRLWRDSTNQGCSSDVWLMTRSATTRMPRVWASVSSVRMSSTVPDSGCTEV